jgi:hypothetical protein
MPKLPAHVVAELPDRPRLRWNIEVDAQARFARRRPHRFVTDELRNQRFRRADRGG